MLYKIWTTHASLTGGNNMLAKRLFIHACFLSKPTCLFFLCIDFRFTSTKSSHKIDQCYHSWSCPTIIT